MSEITEGFKVPDQPTADEKPAKGWQDYGREWLDTLVVAISVAMAFRAYFYEPFNIPTGSMQPTLYGNHSEACEQPGIWQTTPLKWLNWLVSGRDYKEFIAPCDGTVGFAGRGDGRSDFYVVSATGSRTSVTTLPTDALSIGPQVEGTPFFVVTHTALNLGPAASGGRLCVDGRTNLLYTLLDNGENLQAVPVHVKAGQKLWQGYDVTGDFIFVNRWKWNFRQPARGDVMVFATTGITGLQQGTHYIKRLTALPGETIEIRKPDVLIDGKPIDPIKPMTGKRGEPTPLPNDGGERGMGGRPAALGAGEYFACGDNSDNSLDSRYWGPVPERNLKGTGAWVFWPIINPRWGSIK